MKTPIRRNKHRHAANANSLSGDESAFKILQVVFVVLFKIVDARRTGNKGLVDVLVVGLGAEKLFSHLSRTFAQYRNDNEVENVFFKQVRIGVQLANQFVAPTALGIDKDSDVVVAFTDRDVVDVFDFEAQRARSM